MVPTDPWLTTLGKTRIRGHQHGLAVEWTPERFAELVHRAIELHGETDSSFAHIWAGVRSVYTPDEASVELAKAVTGEVLARWQRHRGHRVAEDIPMDAISRGRVFSQPKARYERGFRVTGVTRRERSLH